jgi:hypothetical protein
MGDGIGELFGKHPEFEHVLDGYQRENDFEPAREGHHALEAFDLSLMACKQISGENIGPEDVVFAE